MRIAWPDRSCGPPSANPGRLARKLGWNEERRRSVSVVGMADQDGPTRTNSFVFGLGLGALGVAFVAALYSVGIDGKPVDVIFDFGGYGIGGPTEVFTARAIALVAGTVGIFCVRRTWKDVWCAAPQESRERR
jgi:hypothetical protein